MFPKIVGFDTVAKETMVCNYKLTLSMLTVFANLFPVRGALLFYGK